jgi:hypothetical protein
MIPLAPGAFRGATICDLSIVFFSWNGIVATPSISGTVSAATGATRTLSITFNSSDGMSISGFAISNTILPTGWSGPTNFSCGLVTTDLSSLPSGWSGAANHFACAKVGPGSRCQLALTYAPAARGHGSITLNYDYTEGAGTFRTGSINFGFASTTNDSVTGTPSQNPIATGIGTATPVAITFTTDDASLATNFSVTSGLDALPAGWTSASSTFDCVTVSHETSCVLPLMYAPTVPATGTLTIGFSYTNNSGISKTGTISITYSAT